MNYITNLLATELEDLTQYESLRRLDLEVAAINYRLGTLDTMISKWTRIAEHATDKTLKQQATHNLNTYRQEAQKLEAQKQQYQQELKQYRSRTIALIWTQIRDCPLAQPMHDGINDEIRDMVEHALSFVYETLSQELVAWIDLSQGKASPTFEVPSIAQRNKFPGEPVSERFREILAAEHDDENAARRFVGAIRRRAVRRSIRERLGSGRHTGLLSNNPLADCRNTCQSAEAAALARITRDTYNRAMRSWTSNHRHIPTRAQAEEAMEYARRLSIGELEYDDIPQSRKPAVRAAYRRREEIAIAAGIGSEADWESRRRGRPSSPPPQ